MQKKYSHFISCLLVLLPISVYSKNITDGEFGSPIVGSISNNTPQVAVVLQDQGDYYYTSKGRKASFLRKSNEYLLVRDKSKVSVNTLTEDIQLVFGDKVEIVHQHGFVNETVIRLKDPSMKENLDAIQGMDTSIEFVSPVLQSDKAIGDVGVTPRIIVKLRPMVSAERLVSETLLSGEVSFNSSLIDAHQEYEYQIKSHVDDVGDIFKLSREVMDLPYVEWAEPVLLVAPQSSSYFPNDQFFMSHQWHLHNTGLNGALVDADIDAPEGWDISKGDGAVVAVIDDGVETDHPDLVMWSNPGETGGGKETNGIDDDGNGYIDDYQGWDFGDEDNQASPNLSGSNHGTAVAGVAAANGNNALGVTGSAINAKIFPVKTGSMTCTNWGNTMRYAGKYSDVVNNSWGITACESALDSAINDVVSGNILNSKRGKKGTPVLFASGNAASGWRRFSLSGFPAGSFDFRWEFSKNGSASQGLDTVWLDGISWPGGAISNFEGDALGGLPSGFTGSGNANWQVVSDGVHARGASGKSVKAGGITHNQTTQLNITKNIGSGILYYWVWVSSEYVDSGGSYTDSFKFYVDGTLYHQYTPGQHGLHKNEVGYPASNSDTIAIGGSQDGGPGGVEERVYYSQFGPKLDVVAPTSGGFKGITTTDRTGADGYTNSDYVDGFGGTSSATPLTAGIVADLLSFKPSLSAIQVRNVLRLGVDKIGPYTYIDGKRNDYYGYGRVNLFSALQEAAEIEPDKVVKRGEFAKIVLQYVHGNGYIPPNAAGVFSDVGVGDFHADWIGQLKLQGYTEGCTSTKYCPDMTLTNEQIAKIILRAKYGAGYNPPAVMIAPFIDVSSLSPLARWAKKLKVDDLTEGCNDTGSMFCPQMAITWEAVDKIFFKLSQ